MPGIFETGQVGKREALADLISIVDAKNTPLSSMVPKASFPGNMFMEWQADSYDAPDKSGIVDGSDVSDFENAAENRARFGVYGQILRRTGKVSTLAEDVSDVAGLPKGELAKAKAKKMVEHKRDIEAILGSDNDTQAGTGALPYLARGFGSWISSSAQTVQPVPSAFRTPSGSINSTATASLTEENVSDVLQSVFETTGSVYEFDMVCGSELKHTFTRFTKYASGTDQYQSLRTFNQNASEKKITNTIDVYQGDFGTIRLHLSTFLADGSAAAVGKARGYLIPFDLTELRFAKMPKLKDLPDAGGGPRFYIESILALCVKNPLAFGKFAATT